MIKKIIMIAFLVSYGSNAQTFNKAKLDSLFMLIETNNKGMGSFSIFKEGKEIYHKSIGYSDIANTTKNNKKTKYRIGSITKTFTATIIAKLVEEGKLSFDTTLDTYFPNIPNAKKITIDNLLRHQSGLFNITEQENFASWIITPKSREQMLERFIKNGTVFEPGEETKYSNTNFILLSYIAENIEHKSFSKILESRIIKPLKLQRTEYGKKINPKNNEALPYFEEDSEWKLIKNHTDMSGPMGAGAIVSTASELNAFYESLFSGKLVSDTSLNQMTDTSTGMGMGLDDNVLHGKQIYGHNGGIDGFQSLSIYIPEEKLAVTYIANGAVMSPKSCILAALKIYFGIDNKLPEFKPALLLKTEELDTYLGVYKGDTFPFEIKITNEDAALIVHAKNGPTFSLEAYDKDKFRSEPYEVKMEFLPNQNKMILDFRNKRSEFIRE
ncbi:MULTISPECIES: serine hydrolase domain-containing protein [Aquimarina]|uniref:serine hydrolase domain-containing protein n=1 Tax=Aquimarina TaxID=290174 RepID=UPI0009449221|nr:MULTISPECIES: serine hydrolase domain-containing protein [Aquimarina]